MNVSSIKPGTRILFANVPADGHFNPLTGIAAHLKSIGCDVRWYTSVKYEQKISRMGIPFYKLNKALDFGAQADPELLFPERKNHKSQLAKLKFDLINIFILRGPEYYADLLEIYQEFPFEVLIADITFGGILFVKEKMKIPVIGVDIIPLTETSKDLPPAGLGLLPSNSFFGRRKQDLLRFIADKVLFAKPNRVMRDVFAGYGMYFKGSNFFDIQIKNSTVVLQSGTPGFEYKRSDLSSNIVYVGPLLPCSVTKATSNWFDERLHTYSRVVLVTQGTVERDIEKLMVPTLEALKGTDILVVATTGGSKTKELRERFPQQNIIVEDFIPFGDVMPYADVYVTNGGYGGVLLSIQNELPMVAAGVHEGKNEICARIGFFKLGVNLKTEKPTPGQLHKAVVEVLNGAEYRRNVKKLSEEFRTYNTNQLCEEQVARLLKTSLKQSACMPREEATIY